MSLLPYSDGCISIYEICFILIDTDYFNIEITN